MLFRSIFLWGSSLTFLPPHSFTPLYVKALSTYVPLACQVQALTIARISVAHVSVIHQLSPCAPSPAAISFTASRNPCWNIRQLSDEVYPLILQLHASNSFHCSSFSSFFIIHLSAKGTDGVMKPTSGFRYLKFPDIVSL